MLHNIKYLSLHRVFHGIRFKVNEDWESGKIPFFYALFRRGWNADSRGFPRIVFFHHRLHGLFFIDSLFLKCGFTRISADCLFLTTDYTDYFFNPSKSNVILSKAKNLVYISLCFRIPSLRSGWQNKSGLLFWDSLYTSDCADTLAVINP